MVLGAGEPVTVSDAGSRCQGPALLPLSTRLAPRCLPVGSCGRPVLESGPHGGTVVVEVIEEPAELVERVAALDIGKAVLVACVRVPRDAKPGRRRQEVRTFATTTRSLLALADWLDGLGVTRVVMETGVHLGEAAVYLLEERCACWLVNAHQAKHLPGRPKTAQAGRRLAGQAPPSGACSRAQLRAPGRGSESCGISPATGAPSSTSGPASSVRSRLLEDPQIKLSVVA